MICPVCKHRCQRKSLARLAVPMTFVVNYATMATHDSAAGTLICRREFPKLLYATSEGQRVEWKKGRWQRADGKAVVDA